MAVGSGNGAGNVRVMSSSLLGVGGSGSVSAGGGGGGAPAFVTAPVMTAPSGMVNQQSVQTTDGTYTGTGVTVTYQWRRAGVDISGATASTHVLDGPDVGTLLSAAPSIDCLVTLTNAFGAVSQASNALARTALFDPTSEAGLRSWLDQRGQEAGLPTGLSAWRDQSGGARDVLQPVESERFVAATARGFASPQSTSNIDKNFEGPAISNIVSAAAFTTLGVVNLQDTAANSATVYLNGLVLGDRIAYWGLYLRNNAGTYTLYGYVWDGVARSVAVVITPGWQLVEFGLSAGTLRLRVGSAAAVPTASGNISVLTGEYQVGSKGLGNPGFTGNWGETFTYNTALGATPITNARAALAAKWGVAA